MTMQQKKRSVSETFCPEGLSDHSPHDWRETAKTVGGGVFTCKQCRQCVVGKRPADDLRATFIFGDDRFELTIRGVYELRPDPMRRYYANPVDDVGTKVLGTEDRKFEMGWVEFPDNKRERREIQMPWRMDGSEAQPFEGATCSFFVRDDAKTMPIPTV